MKILHIISTVKRLRKAWREKDKSGNAENRHFETQISDKDTKQGKEMLFSKANDAASKEANKAAF